MCETPNCLECSKNVECTSTNILSNLMQFVFLSEKNILFCNKQGCFLYFSAFFHENTACVINILQSFVTIIVGITISASQPDVTVNIWKKDVTN